MRLSLTLCLGALIACAPDSGGSDTPGAPTTVAVLSGDAQFVDLGDSLPDALRFRVTDAKERPVGGVEVTFVITAGDGSVPELHKLTNANGIVETEWVMGPQGGVQLIDARIASGQSATASAVTCLPGDCYPEERLEGPLSDATLLELATYEASGQTVHPDVVAGHGLMRGYWLAVTPFPGGDLAKENPSIFYSRHADTWNVPAGVTNPLALPSAFTGYLSDPDVVFNPSDRRLWMYFRAYSTQNVISVIRSSDGTHWDNQTTVIAVPSHQLVSPSIVRGSPQAPWAMWSVNAGSSGCTAATTALELRTSTDGLSWSAPQTTDLAQPGQVIWHVDVQWIPARHEYWALYNTYPTGSSCSTHSLYLARSPDGTHWTVAPSPIARSGLVDAFASVIYRSTFLADSKGKRITLWMSGAKYTEGAGYAWHTATVATTAAELLAIAATPAPSFQTTSYRALPPPEP